MTRSAQHSCRCPARRRARHTATGLTLVEVLVALALTGLVLVTATGLARQTMTAARVSHGQSVDQARAEALFDALRIDLQARVSSTPIRAAKRRAEQQTATVLELTSLGEMVDRSGRNRRHLPVKVQYRLKETEDDPASLELLRVREDLTVSAAVRPARGRTVARRLRSFRLRFHDGKAWHDHWPPPSSLRATLRAVEVTAHWCGQDQPCSSRILLDGTTHAVRARNK